MNNLTRRSFFATLAALVLAPKVPRPECQALAIAGQLRILMDETHWQPFPFSGKLSAALHGTEAIITPDQAPAFLRDAGYLPIDLRMNL